MRFKSTVEIPIPKDPLQQVIGQAEAVKIAKLAASQKRHLLLVAPPGTGKSMLAQAIAFHLPKPTEEIAVLHNPEQPERPFVEVRNLDQVRKEEKLVETLKGKSASPAEVPAFVSERLGFRCRRCGRLSRASENSCPNCGADKKLESVFGSILAEYPPSGKIKRVHTTRLSDDGREEVVVYERRGEDILILDQKILEKIDALKRKRPRKVIVPFTRKNFIIATGASETELLGDVRHDPYGGHQGVGTMPYLRVVPGAIHEAHEGVLFIDEISSLQYIQRFLFTAMQEKKYPIVGKNPQSAGASVRVDDVPCDFILVAASNINDLPAILPPLRSRIIGNGYEVLLESWMPASKENEEKLLQFMAQEIRKDGKIPHASKDAAEEIVAEARRRARDWDKQDDAFTLKLRELSGIIRLAGDFALVNKHELIEKEDVVFAFKRGRNIEEQLQDKYGSVWKAGARELAREKKTDQKEIS
ncbi:MAG: ATP-binding protein [Candidatus Micrarchaeota archaeon]